MDCRADRAAQVRAGLSVALACAALALAPGCGSEVDPPEPATPAAVPAPDPPPAELPIATVEVEGFGAFRIALLPHRAPRTVDNFIELATSGFYQGTTFHRVVPGFMIQGGDPNSKDRDPRNDGLGGPGHLIGDEFNQTSFGRGVVGMANNGQPNTAGSQFFIMLDDHPALDGRYTAFGRVLTGMEVVDRIAEVERDLYARWGPQDRPLEDVPIAKVTIQRPAAASE